MYTTFAGDNPGIIGFARLRGRRGEIAEREGNFVVGESRQRKSPVEQHLQFPPPEKAICRAGWQKGPRGEERAAHRESRAVPIILWYGKNARMPITACLKFPMAANEVVAIGGEDDPAARGGEA